VESSSQFVKYEREGQNGVKTSRSVKNKEKTSREVGFLILERLLAPQRGGTVQPPAREFKFHNTDCGSNLGATQGGFVAARSPVLDCPLSAVHPAVQRARMAVAGPGVQCDSFNIDSISIPDVSRWNQPSQN
jgi:hypothetical protein